MKRTFLHVLRLTPPVVLFAAAPLCCAGQSIATSVPAAPSNLSLVASNEGDTAVGASVHTVAAPHEVAVARWADIKDFTYDERALFLLGLNGLRAKVDAQVRELVAKRATLEPLAAETLSWDFAMKEMQNASAYLRSTSNEVDTATRDGWDQMKQKVEYAWQRTQSAYGKVKASTTI